MLLGIATPLFAYAVLRRLGRFKRESNAGIASGRVGPHVVRLVKPLTYMNRSGAALGPLRDYRRDSPAVDVDFVSFIVT